MAYPNDFPTIATYSPAYNRAAGFNSVFIRPSGGLYQTLGAIADGELKFSPYKATTSTGKNKQHAVEFTAKCKMLQAALIEVELVDQICTGLNSFLFKMSDFGAIPGAAAVTEGWTLVTAAQVGCKANIVLDGDADKNTYIELEWQGSMLLSEMPAAVKASIDDDEFEATGGSGTLKAIGIYTSAKDGGSPTTSHILPAGISTITLAETGGTAQTVNGIQNVKFTINSLFSTDCKRRFLPHGFDIHLEYEWQSTDAANLLNLYTMVDTEVDVLVTMLSAQIYTMTNVVGIETSYESAGDYDKVRIVRFIHTGKILKASLDGIVSGS
jgi:hypothetical protein